MAVVIDLSNVEDQRDVVHRAVEAISAGKIIAIPTETVYCLAASALIPSAVERLVAITQGDVLADDALADVSVGSKESGLAFAVKSLDDALDYVPDICPLARRLARRSWPGPVALMLNAKHEDSVIQRLDPSVQAVAVIEDNVCLRVPAHELTLQILRLCAGPVVITSAAPAGHPDSFDGRTVANLLNDQVDLILDDGPTQYQRPASMIRIEGGVLTVLREGVLDEHALHSLTNFIALVVCTGNTCRSPMGEGLLKQRIADRLQCTVDELQSRGVAVLSAGIAAMPGSPAAAQAIQVMNEMGIDIADHSSQPITGRLAQFADVILTMTNGHRQALISHWPTLETRAKTIRIDSGDISDPIGSPVDVYRACARQIDDNLQAWVQKFDLPSSRNGGLGAT